MVISVESRYDDVLPRFHKAEGVLQGLLSSRLVKNDAVFSHWTSCGNYFWYHRTTDNGKEYRLVDPVMGTNNLAFDHHSLATALSRKSRVIFNPNDLDIMLTNIEMPDKKIFFSALNKQWIFSAEGEIYASKDERISDRLYSPNGKKCVFVRSENLWILDVASGVEAPLTTDGTADFCYARAPSPYGWPNTASLQAVWSSDSKRVLTHQLDLRKVESTSFVHHVPDDGCTRPQFTERKISFPGDKNAELYRIVSINVDNSDIQQADYIQCLVSRFAAGYFTEENFGWWSNDCRCAYFIDITRGSKTVRVVEFDTDTGDIKILIEETSNTFVKLSHSVFDRPLLWPVIDRDELILFSERTGWGHLYLYDLKTGSVIRRITQGNWLVRDILHYSPERRELLIQTSHRNQLISPYYRDVCRVNIDSCELTTLASGNYENVVFHPLSQQVKMRYMLDQDGRDVSGVSPSGEFIVVTRSRVDCAPVSILINRSGAELLTLEETDINELPVDWEWPEPICVKSASNDLNLYGVIYKPLGFSPNKLYPVLDFSCVHPGFSYVPHAAFTSGVFCGEAYLLGAAYAALGFIVVAIESPGMPFRNKAFQDISYGHIASHNAFSDRISGLRQLAEDRQYMDLSRVGLIGCDGAADPVFGLLEHPEFYKVGVSIAYDNAKYCLSSLYDMFGGESVDDLSDDLIQSLDGKLLLVHGMADYASPPMATMSLVGCFSRLNKDFDLLLLPSNGHEMSGFMLLSTWKYLIEHLQGVQGLHNNFSLQTSWDLFNAGDL